MALLEILLITSETELYRNVLNITPGYTYNIIIKKWPIVAPVGYAFLRILMDNFKYYQIWNFLGLTCGGD